MDNSLGSIFSSSEQRRDLSIGELATLRSSFSHIDPAQRAPVEEIRQFLPKDTQQDQQPFSG